MKMKTTGLGKGLNAIFEIEDHNNPAAQAASGISEIELSKIKANPNQPRTLFDQESLEELSESIKRLGVIQPITLKQSSGGDYMIISGERRYRASMMAGKTTIAAYVRQAEDEQVMEMALVENIQREDLNAMEIAIAMERLIQECDLTQESLSERVGKKRSTVANYMRLLRLPPEVQLAIRGELISMGHARALAGMENAEKQLSLLDRIIRNGLSVRQTEELVAQAAKPKAQKEKNEQQYPQYYNQLVEGLEKIVGSNISIKRNDKGKGQIVIRFSNEEQIKQIIENLNNIK